MAEIGSAERIRYSSRVVCIDQDGAALLFLHDWSRRVAPARWLTVGGGIEPGETEREAAVRELYEETGQSVPPEALIGPVRHIRQPTPPGHRYQALDMTTFILRTQRFEAETHGREPGEKTSILDERWWTAAEILASNDPFDREDVAGTLSLATSDVPSPGEPVRVRGTKWDGTPHWEYDAVALGRDDEGVWLGVDGSTTLFAKPGTGPFYGDTRKVTLVPRRPLSMLEGTWALVHWDESQAAELYIDICTPPELIRRPDGWTLEYCDLDLDVVRDRGKPVFIDDEDEFADHAVRMRYPAWVRERARASADSLLSAVQRNEAPGGSGYQGWLAQDFPQARASTTARSGGVRDPGFSEQIRAE